LSQKHLSIIAKGTGFSLSFDAVNTKCFFLAKILKAYGDNVTILSGLHYKKKSIDKIIGRYCGVKYYSPSIFEKPNSRLLHYYYKFIYVSKVIVFLIRMKIKWGRVSLIFDDNSIPLPLLYLLQKFSVVELIFNIEEWPLSHNIKLVHKIISHWFVIFAFSVCKKTVCISSYLVERAKYYNKHIAVYKLPALTKFDDFKDQGLILDKIENRHTKFLFCGNTGYLEVIWLIIHSYENFCLLKPLENVKLVLILHGNEMIIRKLSQYINKSKYSIKLLSSLTESELFEQYDQATVLLAPLRPTIQDNARFPQKIAEYTAMSKPIITTNVGDIELYFDSNESAIFMGEFSIEELSQKMIFSVENKEKIRLIGMKGNIAGRKFFNYKQYVTSFGNFIKY